PVLQVFSATEADAGVYTVVAQNELGSVTSDEASLTIAKPPVITTQPVAQIVAQKSNVTFKVAATGSPAPTYQWKKDGHNIPGATQATLDLKSVNKGDAGEYSVEV